MHHFFVEKEKINQTPLCIEKDYNHMRNVLRLKVGDEILLSDGDNTEYICKITEFDETYNKVMLEIIDISGFSRELPAKITLFQGYPKGDKMETIIQKAVELGVYEIVPVMMKRSVVKLDEKRAEKKLERFNAIALGAAKQSKRGIIPQVSQAMSMKEAVNYAVEMDYIIVPYEQAEGMEYSRRVLSRAKGKQRIGVFIGPEGGFSPEEIVLLENNNANMISLGHRILRTETAGMTILSLLMYLLEV